MNNIISVDGLSKKYRIRHNAQRYKSLREEMAAAAANILKRSFNRNSRVPTETTEDFWALKDVNFTVERGDRLGIIGRNGAGKSTLLKILSRITEPTEGRIEIRGRVSSLLEVGTGFHPELTGRENIYLNGAILGMRANEVRQKFDQIVEFAEVERFLDTPVKRYSSGMYVRLAFAVAAHLEPDVLIIDEVLAVGDAAFQKRCLSKMDDSSKEGRTIIFVSHSMSAVERLCNRIIYLESGHVCVDSPKVQEGIRAYMLGTHVELSTSWEPNGIAHIFEWFTPTLLRLVDGNNNLICGAVTYEDEVWCVIEADITTIDYALTMGIALFDEEGRCLFWSYHTDLTEKEWPVLKVGKNLMKVRLPLDILNGGVFRVELIGGLHFRQWFFQPGVNAPSVYLTLSDLVSKSPYWMTKRPCIMAPKLKWLVE
ncbi:MAG: ABC transporter ATP-binding protein [Pseudomonadota bacterium]